MRGGKSKNLSSIFGSAVKSSFKKSVSDPLAAEAAVVASPDIKTLKELLLLPSSSSSSSSLRKSSSITLAKSSKNSASTLKKSASASSPEPKNSGSKTGSEQEKPEECFLDPGNNSLQPLNSPASQKPDDGKLPGSVLDMPWFSNMPQTCISLRRKELSRERKQKWVFKNTQARRFEHLIKMCAEKLGTEATLEVFGKLRRETGIKEYNALIKLCIEKASESNDEDIWIDQIQKAFQLFRSMKEQGFPLQEESFRPVLMYLVDMGRVEEFEFFCGLIKDGNPHFFSRLGYYEMLLWIRVNNEDKVQELCNSVIDSTVDGLDLAVSYLLALCETDKKKELLQVLEVIDMTKISSAAYVTVVFKSLGRLLLENLAEKFILTFKISEIREEDISSFIYNYVISMPNLVVQEVISKFKYLHEKFKVLPSSTSYDKLITYCCDSLQVHAALDIVDEMCQSGLPLTIETFQPILRASEQSFELDLVHPIYSVIRHYDLKPKGETFKSMISLCAKMKDFEGAYNMLKDLGDMNMIPTANMYNAIMAGYFREKNISGGLMVLKQMEVANVKPDSMTFCHLIGSCECEEDIVKYLDEMRHSGVLVTKRVYMALINAYANCGQFEKAKQVVLDQGISRDINEIKGVLASALASNGKIFDALKVYEESKQTEWHLEPKAIISLIENLQSEGELDKLLQLLGELNDSDSWFDGCSRVVLYCVRYKLLSAAVDLLKQLKEKDALATYNIFDQIFSQVLETEPSDLVSGLYLLQAMKEKLDLCPTRTNLDFLLSACVSAKDPLNAELIWEEYQKAGLAFNVLTFLRKYQVLLASGKHVAASKLLKNIQKDDPHVRSIIKACNSTYCGTNSTKGKNKLMQEV